MSFFDLNIYPMEPRLSRELPEGESYRYQVKWDGMRLLAFGCRGRLRLQGKSLLDKTAKYPELSSLPQQVKGEEFILDGELIAMDGGRPSFYNLMSREHRGAAGRGTIPVFYMVFDCLYFEGDWLEKGPWERRQELLKDILTENDSVHICSTFIDGNSIMEAVVQNKLEGVVAKQNGSPYVRGPGKSPHWLKIKLEQTINARVAGILLRDDQAVSLLLGLAEGTDDPTSGGSSPRLRHIGNVSSGFTQQDLAEWKKWGRRHEISSPHFLYLVPKPGRDVLWVEPLRSIDVTFNEWTPELRLRAPRVKK